MFETQGPLTLHYRAYTPLPAAAVQGARATAEAQQLPHEVLTAAQAMQRFPGETQHRATRIICPCFTAKGL